VIADSKMIDTLYDMIRDKDTVVITNAIVALDEILQEERGIATNKALLLHLLSKVVPLNSNSPQSSTHIHIVNLILITTCGPMISGCS
jgi:vesicle coat complex subunit